MLKRDVVIVGGGAAGLMCSIEAGKRGRSVLVIEHNDRIGEKIRISGGGRCNFTNLAVQSQHFISQNPHFCKSALARYPSSAFIDLVEEHDIAYHEKKLGQLFCDGSSHQIIKMLLKECEDAGVEIQTNTQVASFRKGGPFKLVTSLGAIETDSLVIATGGLSVPKLGASDSGYNVAKQFEIGIIEPRPGLVPLKFRSSDADLFGTLSGVSVEALVHFKDIGFRENVLFTHRGMSGPAILQISSFWKDGESITINLLPDQDANDVLRRAHGSKLSLATVLERELPKRFVQKWLERRGGSQPMSRYSEKELREIASELNAWQIVPAGTEGFGIAEVTVGGIDTEELSSKTMEARKVPGLYFVGEVVDVTGWLGGYNFQWAWSSGWVAGQYV